MSVCVCIYLDVYVCNSQLNRTDIFNPSLAKADVSINWLCLCVCACVCVRACVCVCVCLCSHFVANSSQWQINQLSAEHKVDY